jgi:hypothetical protein
VNVQLPHVSSPEQYPNPAQVGPVGPPGEKPRVWPQLLAVLAVGSLAVAAFVVLYRTSDRSASAPMVLPAVAVEAPSEVECLAVLDVYSRWATEAPVTEDQFAELDSQAAVAASRAGQELLAGLQAQPIEATSDLRRVAAEYLSTMLALAAAKVRGTATPAHVSAATAAGASVHQTYDTLHYRICD